MAFLLAFLECKTINSTYHNKLKASVRRLHAQEADSR